MTVPCEEEKTQMSAREIVIQRAIDAVCESDEPSNATDAIVEQLWALAEQLGNDLRVQSGAPAPSSPNIDALLKANLRAAVERSLARAALSSKESNSE